VFKTNNTKNTLYNIQNSWGRDRMLVGFTTTCAVSAYHY